MWLRRSLATALAVAFVSGCSWSESKTYSAQDVVGALNSHGFTASAVESLDPDEEFQRVFPTQVVPEGILTIAADAEECHSRPRPEPIRCPFLLVAMLFKSQENASCDESNILGTCLRKRNAVIVVRDERAEAAREALDDLN